MENKEMVGLNNLNSVLLEGVTFDAAATAEGLFMFALRNKRFKRDASGKLKEEINVVRIVVNGKLAAHCKKLYKKGRRLRVVGELKVE